MEINARVDQLWNDVNEKNPELMNDWIYGFSEDYNTGKVISKQEIRRTLINEVENRWENFLWKLISRDRWRRLELGKLFLHEMMVDPYYKSFVVTTLEISRLKEFNVDPDLINLLEQRTDVLSALLSEAAKLEKVEAVRMLTRAGSGIELKTDAPCTPLHSAAMAINPNVEIAQLLLDLSNVRKHLNRPNVEELGHNTALHIAAANVNVTEAFIQQFKEANPRILNSAKDTPFHVAAKSHNPETIIYLLNTFAPMNNRWDIDDVDKHITPGREDQERIINVCARKGNAKAVALLIKHGADISKGVLHEIVLESVRYPQKISKLVEVYQAIIDNVVTWRCLEEHTEENDYFRQTPDTCEYMERFRQTTIWLLTSRLEHYGKMDVIQCALNHGASRMFSTIINTRSVFRADVQEINSWVCVCPKNECKVRWVDMRYTKKQTWTVYDVTNFTKATKQSDADQGTRQASTESVELSCLCCRREGDEQTKRSDEDQGTRQASTESVELLCLRCRSRREGDAQPQRNLDRPSAPETSYLTDLLNMFNHWKSSNILSVQPLKGLTQRYITLIQRSYLILGIFHLIFMILFTMLHMPNTCALASMFSISNTSCNSSTSNINDDTANHQRSPVVLFWLIWPSILFLGNIIVTVHNIYEAYVSHKFTSNSNYRRVLRATDLHLSFRRRLFEVLLTTKSLRLFCLAMYVWMYIYFQSNSYESYLEVTAVVLLFGWITNLTYFGTVSKNFSVALLVVQKIMVKDIPVFMLIFGFTVLAFSFAMHVLRTSACISDESSSFDETFFSVLTSAFGIGEFLEVTVTNAKCDDSNEIYYFEFVYFLYVCATMIILLNILIAMITNRYEKAKRRAKSTWMFYMLSTLRKLESYKCIVDGMKKWDSAVSSRVRNDYTIDRLLIRNTDSNRYYLMVEVPVDTNVD